MGCSHHLRAVEFFSIATDSRRYRLFGRWRNAEIRPWIVQDLCGNNDQQALPDSSIEERSLVVGIGKHTGDDGNKQRRASAESRGDETGNGASLVREPLQCCGNGAAIDERSADSGGSIENVKLGQRLGETHAGPTDTH